MVRKSFKEVMKDDVNNTFMNVDEFADIHTVDGKEIPVLVDDNEIIERKEDEIQHGRCVCEAETNLCQGG